jgi:hypothetical protein
MTVLAMCSELAVVEVEPLEFVDVDEAIPRIRANKIARRNTLRFWVILNIGFSGGVGSARRILHKANK